MTLWLDDGDVRLYHGDALDVLRGLPTGAAQMMVTSPPFWGLRDYGVAGQIGLEASPEEWCARLVAVFREARRVLRDDGTAWIEVGDAYNGSGGFAPNAPVNQARERGEGWGALNPSGRAAREAKLGNGPKRIDGLKPKDLVGAPWMLAFALRADGWYLRSDCIWSRPNPMPESVTDRPTKAHSYVFLLSKQPRYFYDADAIREAISPNWTHNGGAPMPERGAHVLTEGSRGHQAKRTYVIARGANARSIWSIPTEPTPFAHFATFPQALVERCVKAGTSEHGACSECEASWRRTVEREAMVVRPSPKRAGWQGSGDAHARTQIGGTVARPATSTTTGWEPSCGHDAPVRPCVVLDPFIGSGTTGLVARRLGRHAIGIELNEDYLKIASERLMQPSLLSTPLAFIDD